MRKDSVKLKYENLLAQVAGFVKQLRARKTISAFSYLKTEQPPAVHGLAEGPKQFNIVQIQELINHVMTANQLGYDTFLQADPQTLTVRFVEKYPQPPYQWGAL
jgi:hypothetical protein